jgi:type IV pilus assembly protein PilE
MRAHFWSARSERGMSLIELVTVVAIAGLLAAIAIPSYRNYVIRVKRTDAKTELMNVAQRLERCYTRANTYTGCITLPVNAPTGATGSRVTYVISGSPDGQAFDLTATPQNGQADDTKCGNFTLNQVGARGASGSMSAEKCWQGSGG